MTDKVVVGSLSGIIGAFLSGMLAVILNYLKITTIRMLFFDSFIFLPNHLANSLVGSIYGFIIHLIIGAIIGIIFMYFFPFTGSDYLIYKGILLGAISWLVIGGLVGTMIGLTIRDNLLDNTIYFGLNIVFGLITILSANYFRRVNIK